jgi:hypothetical protein
MAKPSATVVKTQAALIATAINTALSDTVLTGIHPDWKDPAHPIRDIMDWLIMDNQGTFTANDDYIDDAHADLVHTNSLGARPDKITDAPS